MRRAALACAGHLGGRRLQHLVSAGSKQARHRCSTVSSAIRAREREVTCQDVFEFANQIRNPILCGPSRLPSQESPLPC
jgi:hypothetical protein